MKGFHHFYLGLVLSLAAFWGMLRSGSALFPVIFFVSLLIMIDDFIQHWIQKTTKDYLSPLHLLYAETLYKIKFIRKLNEFIDKIFGVK